jgi:hypothetical protein
MNRWFLVAVVALAPGVAFAQNTSEATRLFTEARALLEQGKTKEACARFEASLKAGAGTGTMLYLGDCYEKIGRPASAYAMYQGAEGMARANQDPREATAHELAQKLAPRVSTLTLRFAKARERGFELRRDDELLAQGDLDGPIYVDPGHHKLEARAIGKVPWTHEIDVGAEKSTLVVDVPPLRDVPPVVVTKSSSAQRVVGVAVAGVALVGVGIGSYFGVTAIDLEKSTEGQPTSSPTYCSDQNVCHEQGKANRDTARAYALAADISIGVGVAGIIAGAILFFTAPKSRVTPVVRSGAAGLAIQF